MFERKWANVSWRSWRETVVIGGGSGIINGWNDSKCRV
jgi:hypothetical protein